MAKAEFLMLAKVLTPHMWIGGHYVSVKLNGQRWFWDGGATRGLPKSTVPWANNAKDARYVEEPVATGLWTRYGNVVHAPDYWLDQLPNMPLDGEGYTQRGASSLQDLQSITSKINPVHEEWEPVTFRCFEIPSWEQVFATRMITGIHFTKYIDQAKCFSFLSKHAVTDVIKTVGTERQPSYTFKILERELAGCPYAKYHPQTQLDDNNAVALQQLEELLTWATEQEEEGLMLRDPKQPWVAIRSPHLLKAKEYLDDEGVIKDFYAGKKTAKGSKHLGKLGSVELEWNGVRFSISGFNTEERVLRSRLPSKSDYAARDWAVQNPGGKLPHWITPVGFALGNLITFRYRGVTGGGIPTEASYSRKPDTI